MIRTAQKKKKADVKPSATRHVMTLRKKRRRQGELVTAGLIAYAALISFLYFLI
jgi:hypothetical protein